MHIESIGHYFHSYNKTPEFHSDNYYEFHYISYGKANFIINDKINPVKSGDFFFNIPLEKHKYIFRPGNKGVWQYIIKLYLTGNDSEIKAYIEKELLQQRYFYIGNFHKYFFENLKKLLETNDDSCIRSSSYQLIGFIYNLKNITGFRRNPENVFYIDQALDKMHESIDIYLDMKELAEKLGISLSYFIRIFKKSLGIPPKQYHLNLKIAKACHYLAHTNLKIYQISANLNFSNEFHFSKLFKQNKGISPLEFRKQFSSNSYI